MNINLRLLIIFSLSFYIMVGCSNYESRNNFKNSTDDDFKNNTVKANRKAAEINVELGLGYLEQGQIPRAKKKLVRALQLDPRLPEAHSAMGYFWENVGETKDAETEYKKAIRLSNGKGAFYNNYGTYLCRAGKYKEAETAFLAAVKDKDYPRTAEVYENAGLCSLEGLDSVTAEVYLATAVKRDPSRIMAHLKLAKLYLDANDLAKADLAMKNYRRFSSPTAESLWLGIQIADALGDLDKIASQGLMLKSQFNKSAEYKKYLEYVK